MTPTSFLLMFAVLVVGIVIGVAGALVLKRYPVTEQYVQQALLLVALALRATFSDAEVDAAAGYVYDNTMVGQYYSREAWLALVRRMFAMLPQKTAVVVAQEVAQVAP